MLQGSYSSFIQSKKIFRIVHAKTRAPVLRMHATHILKLAMYVYRSLVWSIKVGIDTVEVGIATIAVNTCECFIVLVSSLFCMLVSILGGKKTFCANPPSQK